MLSPLRVYVREVDREREREAFLARSLLPPPLFFLLEMRSYCVIPHSARESPFFHAVFEDGVRVEHDGRMLSLPFTHVLSPAHDLAKHINGPLLEAVRDGHNAMLLVALPAATAGDDKASGSPSQPPPQSPPQQQQRRHGERSVNNSRATASSSVSGLQECSEVAMELYANLLPLFFYNAASCGGASVSVVTASSQDRTIVDELAASSSSGGDGGRRVRSLTEVSWTHIARESSASEWGRVVSVLANRHMALTGPSAGSLGEGTGGDDGGAAASLAAQTACVVTVQLEDGYGRVVLVDVGSDQELLQSLTLILGVGGQGKQATQRRTYPARTPLLTLLQANVANSSLTSEVHVVAVPNPMCAPRHSLRIMRWASDSIFYGDPSSIRADTPGGAGGGGSPSKPREPHQPLAKPTTAPLPPAPGVAPPLPSPKPALAVDPQAQLREQHLVARVAALEAQLRDLSAERFAVKAAREHVEKQVDTLKASLREKHEAWLLSEERNAAVRKENTEFAELVPKLLKKVSVLERKRDELLAAQAAATKSKQATEALLKKEHEALVALQRRATALERKETARARLANLQRLSAVEGDNTSSPHRAESPVRDRVMRVTLEELRRRNRELQQSLADAEERAKRQQEAAAAPPRPSTTVCTSCEQLQERLVYFMRELANTRREKDQLVQVIVAKEAQHSKQHLPQEDVQGTAGGSVRLIVSSLLEGCASLRSQLHAIQEAISVAGCDAAAPPRSRGNGSAGIDPCVVCEHLRAVEALDRSIREIGSRRCRAFSAPQATSILGKRHGEQGTTEDTDAVADDGCAVPRAATAGDIAAFTSLLTFEAERVTHLRAFLPTFAQLAVATEHMRMRLRSGKA